MTDVLARLASACLILLLWIGQAGAQSLPFRHYTPDSDIAPLPSSEVQKVFQDDGGFIWFAVYSSGVARYDGERLQTFTDADGLRDLNVYEIVQDDYGRLWVGSDAGLAVSSRPLSEYPVGERTTFEDSLAGMPLTDLSVRQNLLIADSNVVWVAPMDLGILRYEIGSSSEVMVDTFLVEGPHLFQSLDVDTDGTLIVTGALPSGGVVWRLRPDQTDLEPIFRLESDIPSGTGKSLDGSLLIGTRGGRLLAVDSLYADLTPEEIAVDLGGVVVGIVERSEDDLWVATEGGGLVRVVLDETGYERGHTSVPGVLSVFVHQVKLDREGNLWIAQSGGASKLPHNFDAFDAYSADKGAIGSDLVTSTIPPRDDGCLWVGTIGGGITCIDALGNSFTLNEELPINRVNAMVEGPDGTIWLGTPEGILALTSSTARFDLEQSSVPVQVGGPVSGTRRVVSFAGLDASIEAVGTIDIRQSPTSNQTSVAVWFAASESVVLHYRGSWITLAQQNGLPSSIFRAVEVDDEGFMWIGTTDRGLYRSAQPVFASSVIAATGLMSTMDVAFDQIWSESQGAPSNEIESILLHERIVWVGTGAGLAALDPSSGIVGLVLGPDEGLPAPNATSIDLSPNTGTIWVGTNAGLAEVDPAAREVLRTITKADGLIDNEVCYYGSVRIGTDGSIYYGTCAGLAVYRPHLDQENAVEPKPTITSLRFREDAWGNNELLVTYAGLSFANERQVRYLTRLLGLRRRMVGADG